MFTKNPKGSILQYLPARSIASKFGIYHPSVGAAYVRMCMVWGGYVRMYMVWGGYVRMCMVWGSYVCMYMV